MHPKKPDKCYCIDEELYYWEIAINDVIFVAVETSKGEVRLMGKYAEEG